MSTRAERRAALAQELSPDAPDVTVEDTLPDPVPPPLVANEPASAFSTLGSVSLSAEALQGIITTAVTAAVGALGAGNLNVGEQIAQALKQNRQPIPENGIADFPNKSVYHPAGTLAEPKPTLRAPHFLGVWDQESGKAIAAFPIDDKLMRTDEIHAANAMVPGSYEVTRSDGSKVRARVVEIEDATGAIHRVIIALPLSAYDRDHRNTLPSMLSLAQQLAPAVH